MRNKEGRREESTFKSLEYFSLRQAYTLLCLGFCYFAYGYIFTVLIEGLPCIESIAT